MQLLARAWLSPACARSGAGEGGVGGGGGGKERNTLVEAGEEWRIT